MEAVRCGPALGRILCPSHDFLAQRPRRGRQPLARMLGGGVSYERGTPVVRSTCSCSWHARPHAAARPIVLVDERLKSRPEPGLDCLICAEFGRQRAVRHSLRRSARPSGRARCAGCSAIKHQPLRAPHPKTARKSGRHGAHVQRFRGGLVFKAHRLCVYHSTLGVRVIKKKNKTRGTESSTTRRACAVLALLVRKYHTTLYRGTSLIRNTHPPRITIGP